MRSRAGPGRTGECGLVIPHGTLQCMRMSAYTALTHTPKSSSADGSKQQAVLQHAYLDKQRMVPAKVPFVG
jgi:hypothetical protein